ncbi:MAG: hypothetical protein JWN95_2509 [Frankiales bacterium]|nr:hypothetical protein [Frankiales bacterium]
MVDRGGSEERRRGIHDLDVAERVCRTALTLVRPRLTVVVIDAYTDYRKQLKHAPEAAAAENELRRRGAVRRRGDPGMGVCLD